METITINKNELKQIIEDTMRDNIRDNIIDILSTKQSYLEAPVLEAIETIGLANAIDIGMQSETIDKNDFLKNLEKKIENL